MTRLHWRRYYLSFLTIPYLYFWHFVQEKMSQHTSQISILLGGDNNLVFPTEVRAGRVPGGTIILPENEHNDQERSHCSKKKRMLRTRS